VVILGHKHDEPGKAAFIIAHEVGHIAASDCSPDHPVVDEEEEVADDADIERRADQYATSALIGKDDIPDVDANNYRDLATKSSQIERSSGVDAGAVIYAWARRTGDYAKASMAVKALYRASGARRSLKKHFDLHVDVESASESDRMLLYCVFGGPDRDAAAR
jgi:Zn-dependent peptidase ImmA (M78 family)